MNEKKKTENDLKKKKLTKCQSNSQTAKMT